jgi:hypothetical protein
MRDRLTTRRTRHTITALTAGRQRSKYYRPGGVMPLLHRAYWVLAATRLSSVLLQMQLLLPVCGCGRSRSPSVPVASRLRRSLLFSNRSGPRAPMVLAVMLIAQLDSTAMLKFAPRLHSYTNIPGRTFIFDPACNQWTTRCTLHVSSLPFADVAQYFCACHASYSLNTRAGQAQFASLVDTKNILLFVYANPVNSRLRLLLRLLLKMEFTCLLQFLKLQGDRLPYHSDHNGNCLLSRQAIEIS